MSKKTAQKKTEKVVEEEPEDMILTAGETASEAEQTMDPVNEQKNEPAREPTNAETGGTQAARQGDFEEMLKTVSAWSDLTNRPMWKSLYRAVMRTRNRAVIECSRCKKADLDHPQAVVQVAEDFFAPITAAIKRLNDYQQYYPLETWNSACVRAEFDHDPAALGEPILATGAVVIIGLSAEEIGAVASEEVAQEVAEGTAVDEGETGEGGAE